MIHYAIKFLISFSLPQSAVKTKSVKGTQKKVEVTLEETDENLVECKEQARNWCHIEYSLLEGILPKVELNVVTWGPAVKIYTKHDCRSIKTYTVGDLVWVHFMVLHNVNDLVNEEVEIFKNSFITFSFSQDQEKMMKKVVNDWPKTFKICKKPEETAYKHLFPELHQTDPLDADYKEVLRERIEKFNMSRPEKKSITSMLQVLPCEKKIDDKINELLPILQSKAQFEQFPRKARKKEKSHSKVKKETKNKIKAEESKDKRKLVIKSELLIAGKRDIFYDQREIFPTLRYAAVYVSSSKILTEEQDFTFMPLTVTIESVEDLPLKYLQTLKIKNIYAQYEFPNVCSNIETVKHSLNKDVVFDDTHVFFISYFDEKVRFANLMLRPSILSLAEALMTRYFVLKLYGESDTSSDVSIHPSLFGSKSDDKFIGIPNHEMFLSYKPPSILNSEVFLGSACFNLIKLAKGFCTVEVSAVVTTSPVSRWDPAFKLDELLDSVDNQRDREAILDKFTTPGCIPNHLLIKQSTRVTITVSIGGILSNLTENQLLEMTNVYNRVIIVFKNNDNATDVFQHIVEVNNKLGNAHRDNTSLTSGSIKGSYIANILNISRLDHEGSQFNSSYKLSRTRTQSSFAGHLKEIQKNIFTSNKILTGFFIDNKDESFIVVETIPYITPHVIEFLHALTQNDAHIIHDSSIFFTKRIYNDFPSVKIYTIKLGLSISSLIKIFSKHIKNCANDSALQTLLLLDLLRRSQTVNSASVNQLFPSCDQLIMFNNYFGKSGTDLQDEFEISRT